MSITLDLIDKLLAREGGYSNNPNDRGGETIYGIAKKRHPEMWKEGPPSLDKARAFYATRFLEPYRLALLPQPLDDQVLDYAVNSGPHLAIMKLQVVLGVTVDGEIGPETLHAVVTQDLRRTNNNLMAERLKMLARLVQKDRSQAEFIVGWTARALSFLV